MTAHLPMPIPRCRQHGPMTLRPGRTENERWHGTWYACQSCTSSALLESPALSAQLAQQARSAAPATAKGPGRRGRTRA